MNDNNDFELRFLSVTKKQHAHSCADVVESATCWELRRRLVAGPGLRLTDGSSASFFPAQWVRVGVGVWPGDMRESKWLLKTTAKLLI